ncbi:hypothetical protein BKA58DRAFT_469460 [Alternaria rosae]|uniref:uncharacterized protein n=1 Tax=Alternaria rosae TaxID=1187941 RepID=UPI001E8E5096|nr:uncharacterized protein BKA58DRAFT_469460 [Alternaria rosae]KAH6870434.1 hypothetical protein BKA58DRAFT_469460 [Alternaria rosae]
MSGNHNTQIQHEIFKAPARAPDSLADNSDEELEVVPRYITRSDTQDVGASSCVQQVLRSPDGTVVEQTEIGYFPPVSGQSLQYPPFAQYGYQQTPMPVIWPARKYKRIKIKFNAANERIRICKTKDGKYVWVDFGVVNGAYGLAKRPKYYIERGRVFDRHLNFETAAKDIKKLCFPREICERTISDAAFALWEDLTKSAWPPKGLLKEKDNFEFIKNDENLITPKEITAIRAKFADPKSDFNVGDCTRLQKAVAKQNGGKAPMAQVLLDARKAAGDWDMSPWDDSSKDVLVFLMSAQRALKSNMQASFIEICDIVTITGII